MIKRLVQLLYFKRERYKKRKIAIEKIEQSKDVQTLRLAIKLLGEAEGLPYNLTLSEWAHSYREHFDTEFERLLKRVSRFCYSDNKESDLGTIRSDLLAFVKHKDL